MADPDPTTRPPSGQTEGAGLGNRSAELVLHCVDVSQALQFYVEQLGFRLDVIFPADAPRVAMISGYGMRIRLDRDADAAPATLYLSCKGQWQHGFDTSEKPLAPDGTRIFRLAELYESVAPPLLVPEIIVQRAEGSPWSLGRAGMQYRDLIPSRLNGRYIASHIRIPDGGPVPDYVHHHQVQFQLIYCRRGSVRVVYEDQGPAFTMEAGDCVLQPPHIRHRVLESSPGLEVIEVSCPAEHLTLVDHDMELPTGSLNRDRDFAGQSFVLHKAACSAWRPGPYTGFESADTEIEIATRGFASVRTVRCTNLQSEAAVDADSKCWFNFVLEGAATLECVEKGWGLSAGDAFVIPPATPFSLSPNSTELKLLQVSLS